MKAHELVGTNPIAVKACTEVKGTRWMASYKFPKSFLILNATRYNTTTVGFNYFNGKRTEFAEVPADFEIMKLSMLQKKLVGSYKRFLVKNLQGHLSRTSYNIGSDPEVFVENSKGLMAAFDFLPSKDKAPVEIGGEKAYWDGFQAEFSTLAGACLAYHVDSVQRGLTAVLREARKQSADAKLSFNTVMNISPEQLQNSAPEHVEFGCMPSMNVYGIEGIKAPGREVPFRSAGGHIHFGIGAQSPETMSRIVKALDAIIGVACVSLFANFDDPRRRAMYGLPGEYRLPKHGLEYRALSNAWLIHPLLMHLVFDVARKALIIGEKDLLAEVWQCDEAEVIQIMRDCDVKKAREVLERNKNTMITILKACYYDRPVEIMFDAFVNGLETIVTDPKDIHGNWCLDGNWVNHGGANGQYVASYLYLVTRTKKAS